MMNMSAIRDGFLELPALRPEKGLPRQKAQALAIAIRPHQYLYCQLPASFSILRPSSVLRGNVYRKRVSDGRYQAIALPSSELTPACDSARQDARRLLLSICLSTDLKPTKQ
jgi:hypothetical protein